MATSQKTIEEGMGGKRTPVNGTSFASYWAAAVYSGRGRMSIGNISMARNAMTYSRTIVGAPVEQQEFSVDDGQELPGIQEVLPGNTVASFSLLQAQLEGQDASATSPTALAKEEVLSKRDEVVKEFREYMKKTPAERMHDLILQKMGLTEEDLKAMSPEMRAKVEEAIVAEVRELMQEKVAKKLEEDTAKQVAAVVTPGVPSQNPDFVSLRIQQAKDKVSLFAGA